MTPTSEPSAAAAGIQAYSWPSTLSCIAMRSDHFAPPALAPGIETARVSAN